MRLRFIFFIIILIDSYTICYPQISYPGKPARISINFQKNFQFIEVNRPPANNENEQKQNNGINYKSDFFADNVNVHITPYNSGKWDSSRMDVDIWRVGLFSKDASSLGIIFNRYKLQSGAKLFLYSLSENQILGAFTFRNNNRNDLLAIEPIHGDSIIIELQVQKQHKFGELEISQIALGFPVAQNNKTASDRWYGTSADCHVDVNCLDDKQINIQKHSVCKILYNNTSRCTGTLINNTANNARPIVLTAAHCISTDRTASTAVFFFDYESPYCDGPDVASKTISGSNILATNEELDFTLVELNEKVPIDFHPVYSGWDNTTNYFSKTYTIHHPMGDVKKISINNDPVSHTSYYGVVDNSYWIVPDYEIGSSEIGSSGSALFDSVFHIRGTLTSGDKECTPIIDDYYARFDRSWNYYSDSSMQLSSWLNPQNLPIAFLNRHIPSDPLLQYSEEISNITSSDVLIAQEYKSGWGYPSGINSDSSTEYAEHFYRNGTKYIYALRIGVAKTFTFSNHSKIIFKIWDGKQFPENLLFEKELYLFELDMDLNLIRLDTAIRVNKDFFIGYEIKNPDPSDTLALLYADPYLKQSNNTAYVRKNNTWIQLNDGENEIKTSLAIYPLVFNYYVDQDINPTEFPKKELTLYPNPAFNHIQLLFKNKPEGEFIYKIYDLYGRELINKGNIDIEQNYSIDIKDLPQGVYIIKVYNLQNIFKNKFIKLD